mmetsp:Transcript_7153/g.20838  ORF Transcript_7153/g.20838 Transcript_7153/m.20838 type:complete len:270 (-) Transcript_7153:65-874(-)
MGQATRKDRRLYVGNLPIGAGLADKQLSEFVSTAMKQRGLIAQEAPDPVLSVWLSPEGTYAFVEFQSPDIANLALGLNGIMLLTSALRISRPNNYQVPVANAADAPGLAPQASGGGSTGVVTGEDAASRALAAAAALAGVGPMPTPAALSAMTAQLAAGAGAGAGAAGAGGAPACTSTVISCSNMLTPAELADPEEREGLKEDVTEECARFGKLLGVKVPADANPDCCAYVRFESLEAAAAAIASLSGRKFDGRTVGVLSVDEAAFDAL